jgi:hypothetical protein
MATQRGVVEEIAGLAYCKPAPFTPLASEVRSPRVHRLEILANTLTTCR